MAGTFVGATAAGTANVDSLAGSWPSGVASGDIALFPWSFVNTATPVDPGGMSLLDDNIKGSDRLRLLYRYCDGSESGTITAATTGTFNRQTWVLAVFRGYQYISGFSVRLETTSGTSHATPVIATTDSFGGNSPAPGDTLIIVSSARDGATTTAMVPPAGYNVRTGTRAGISGSGGTSTALADDGLGNAVTLPKTPGAFTGYGAATSSAVEMTIALRPVVTASTATLAAIMAGMATSNSASAILAATSTATLAAFSASLSSNVLATGNMPATLGTLASSGAGSSKMVSTHGQTMPSLTSSASEVSKTGATHSQTMPSLTASAAEASKIASTHSQLLPSMTLTASGQTIDAGTFAGSLGHLVASAVAAGLITSSLASTMPTLSAGSSGALIDSSAHSQALPAMISSLTGEAPTQLTLTSSLPLFSATANGSALAIGGLSGALPPATNLTAGRGRSGATLTGLLPAVEADSSGDLSDSAGLTHGLPGVQAGVGGGSTSPGVVQATVTPLVGGLVGEVEIPATPTGAVSLTLPSPGTAVGGSASGEADLTAMLPAPHAALIAAVTATGGVGGVLPSPTARATGEGVDSGEVPLAMPSIVAAVESSSSEETVDVQVDLTMMAMSAGLGGEARVEGTLMIDLPSMIFEARETPPQLTLSCYVEDESLLVGVEEEVISASLETEALDSDIFSNLYSYIEGDRLEAVVQ